MHAISANACVQPDYPLNLSISLRGGKETNWDSLSSGERKGKSPRREPKGLRRPDTAHGGLGNVLERTTREGDSPVLRLLVKRGPVLSRVPREWCPKKGGVCLPRLNIAVTPIANKYREGKMKSTLKRE